MENRHYYHIMYYMLGARQFVTSPLVADEGQCKSGGKAVVFL